MIERLKASLAQNNNLLAPVYNMLRQCPDIMQLTDDEKTKLLGLRMSDGTPITIFAFVMRKDMRVFSMLLSAGADLKQPLYEASEKGNLPSIAMLLKIGVKLGAHQAGVIDYREPEGKATGAAKAIFIMHHYWQEGVPTTEFYYFLPLTRTFIAEAYKQFIAAAKAPLLVDNRFIDNYFLLALGCNSDVVNSLINTTQFARWDSPKYFHDMKLATANMNQVQLGEYVDSKVSEFCNEIKSKYDLLITDTCNVYRGMSFAPMTNTGSEYRIYK